MIEKRVNGTSMQEEAEQLIEVRHLTKLYGGHAAVDDLSFTVEDGTIYGFLGANGAGKSTTMNIMTGYLAPTDGEVIINGHNILDEPEEAKRTIGYLPEIPPVYPDMTVYEYLRFAAEIKKIPKAEREDQIEQAAGELELGDVTDRLIRNLSKGYRQRVGFAQALLGEPETLILDEPTVGLDPRQIIEIRDLIRKLGQSHTVILSSHILAEVSEVCDKVLIINKGRFVACDTPDHLAAERERGATLTVHAEGTPAELEAAVRTVPGVTDVSSFTENGESCVRIAVPGDQDIRAEVSRALMQAGLMILEMRTEKESLESIFLELTQGEENASGEAEGPAPAAEKLRLRKADGVNGEDD